jgi:cytochrome c-type biogenesis protein CcmH/NrfG
MSHEDPCVALAAHLVRAPDDAGAWFELARHRLAQTHVLQAAARMRVVPVASFFDLFDRTKEAFDHCVRLEPQNATYWSAKAHFLIDLHTEPDTDREALEAFGRALALDPADFESWVGQATTLLRTGDKAGALTALRRASALRRDELREWSWAFSEVKDDPEFSVLFGPWDDDAEQEHR